MPCKHGHLSERYTSTADCVECTNLNTKSWVDKNPTKRKQIRKKSRLKHIKKSREASIAWTSANPGRNRAYVAKYNAAKKKRTPAWANLKKIERIYELAAWASRFTNEPIEVDHIIPLQGELISGLHVENNLQLLPKSANCGKGNRYP